MVLEQTLMRTGEQSSIQKNSPVKDEILYKNLLPPSFPAEIGLSR
jgi:hypothetical protein